MIINEILKIILSLSVSGGLAALILFALKPLYKNRLKKSWQYYIWFVVLLRMLLPFTPEVNLIKFFSASDEPYAQPYTPYKSLGSSAPFTLPRAHPATPAPVPGADNPVAPVDSMDSIESAESIEPYNPVITNEQINKIDLSGILIYLWLIMPVTALVLMARKIIQYRRYVHFIRAGCSDAGNGQIYEIYEQIRRETGVKRQIPLYVNPFLNTPMLVGIIHPYIVLPNINLSENDCRMILRHELTHYKRRDILYKWFVQAVVCLHWFNPLAYLIRKEIYKNCELSCDEAVLSSLDAKDKFSYGDALIASVKSTESRNHNAVPVILITMSEDGKNLKERLESIIMYSKKTILTGVFSCILALMLITGAFFLGAYTAAGAESDTVNPDEAASDGLLDAGKNPEVPEEPGESEIPEEPEEPQAPEEPEESEKPQVPEDPEEYSRYYYPTGEPRRLPFELPFVPPPGAEKYYTEEEPPGEWRYREIWQFCDEADMADRDEIRYDFPTWGFSIAFPASWEGYVIKEMRVSYHTDKLWRCVIEVSHTDGTAWHFGRAPIETMPKRNHPSDGIHTIELAQADGYMYYVSIFNNSGPDTRLTSFAPLEITRPKTKEESRASVELYADVLNSFRLIELDNIGLDETSEQFCYCYHSCVSCGIGLFAEGSLTLKECEYYGY